MGMRDEFKSAGIRLLSDPRLLKLLQNEQLLRTLSTLIEVPDRLGELGSEQGARFAKNLHLATDERVRSLEARLELLEAEVASLRQAR